MKNTMIDAMAAAGLQPHTPLDLIPNGKIHRFRLVGDKSGSRNGWAVLHSSKVYVEELGQWVEVDSGSFGSWKTGQSIDWCQNIEALKTPVCRKEVDRQRNEARERRSAERTRVQAEARTKAQRLWSRAKPATNAHPYLVRKRVNAYGLKQLRDMLLIPARDLDGTLHTLQFISADGTKRFLTGGRIAGCYCAIGKPTNPLLIAEGLATAATLYQATGLAVAMCFSCGNMEAVARALRKKFPLLRLILCADNDLKTKGNPGLTHALQAAQAVGGYVAIPKFNAGAQCQI
jgi:putative DNA primase/helicase